MTDKCRATAQKLGLFLALAPGVFLIGASPETQVEQRRVVSLSLDRVRPLAEAIETLEKRFGWIITYEEPLYVYSGDIVDVTASVRRDGRLSPRIMSATGIPFNFEYDIPPERAEPDEETLLRALLDQYHLSGNPGVFSVAHSAYAYHVVPSRIKNSSGVFERYHAALDTNISVPAGGRTVYEMVEAIVRAATAATAVNMGVGAIPTNLFFQTRLERSAATTESARAVLLRTLLATHRKLSWQLLCDPGYKGCALNIHMVN